MASIYRFEPENVAKKCSVCLCVFTVDNYVRAKNHLPTYRDVCSTSSSSDRILSEIPAAMAHRRGGTGWMTAN